MKRLARIEAREESTDAPLFDGKKKVRCKVNKEIQYIRSRCDGITSFVICKLIQSNL